MNKILSCSPVAQIETMNLIPADFQFQPGVPVSALTANAWWLQESEASVCMRDESQTLHCLNRYSDREGYLSSIDQAIRECMHLSQGYKLSPSSMQSLFIQVSIKQIAVFELFSQSIKFSWDKHKNWRQYDLISNNWCQIQYPDQPITTHNMIKPVKYNMLLEQAVVWDSTQPINHALHLVKEFKIQWKVDDLRQASTHSDYNVVAI